MTKTEIQQKNKIYELLLGNNNKTKAETKEEAAKLSTKAGKGLPATSLPAHRFNFVPDADEAAIAAVSADTRQFNEKRTKRTKINIQHELGTARGVERGHDERAVRPSVRPSVLFNISIHVFF